MIVKICLHIVPSFSEIVNEICAPSDVLSSLHGKNHGAYVSQETNIWPCQ
jgi:hypothetical protein